MDQIKTFKMWPIEDGAKAEEKDQVWVVDMTTEFTCDLEECLILIQNPDEDSGNGPLRYYDEINVLSYVPLLKSIEEGIALYISKAISQEDLASGLEKLRLNRSLTKFPRRTPEVQLQSGSSEGAGLTLSNNAQHDYRISIVDLSGIYGAEDVGSPSRPPQPIRLIAETQNVSKDPREISPDEARNWLSELPNLAVRKYIEQSVRLSVSFVQNPSGRKYFNIFTHSPNELTAQHLRSSSELRLCVARDLTTTVRAKVGNMDPAEALAMVSALVSAELHINSSQSSIKHDVQVSPQEVPQAIGSITSKVNYSEIPFIDRTSARPSVTPLRLPSTDHMRTELGTGTRKYSETPFSASLVQPTMDRPRDMHLYSHSNLSNFLSSTTWNSDHAVVWRSDALLSSAISFA